MKYKLLVLDVDGTLLDSEKKISKRTLAALLKVQQMGVRIVLASGLSEGNQRGWTGSDGIGKSISEAFK